MSVFPSSVCLMPHRVILWPAACLFWQFPCGFAEVHCALSEMPKLTDYQSVIHHFDGLLQPLAAPVPEIAPCLLFTCLAHSPAKKSHASSRIL